MVVLPGGSFSMGSRDGRPSEQPEHQVTIAAPFAIGEREVTIREWNACATAGLSEGSHNDPSPVRNRPHPQLFAMRPGGIEIFGTRMGIPGPRPVHRGHGGCAFRSSDPSGQDDRPVTNLSWDDAQAYVAWLSKVTGESYRLPSEAEWEYAARGGTTTTFWWGEEVGTDHANCGSCAPFAKLASAAVGSFAPNPFGLFDTAGNAAEWVEDCWTPNYDGAPNDGRAVTSASCRQHVLRGGAFNNDARYLRSAARSRYDTAVRYYANGFRVVREVGRL